ncbi:8562_t:CDS:2 [Cetraspora pellucida]|uniref:8562_t:CDS:1 n=1 Tax=Cetraspora pellucida TaxID=1433469 RepID=A0A9N9HTJ9_9GLOM|nr:8562_t:CDS:2 [Cetraspora pellucida]
MRQQSKELNVTDNLKDKIDNCPDKEHYKDLKFGIDKLCYNCYIKIVDSHRFQKSTINRINKSDFFDNSIEVSGSNTFANLMDINNLIESSESNSSIEININLQDENNSINLIELIKTQKEELIQNNLTEIDQIKNIKINKINNMILFDKENFNQLIKLII